MATALRDTPEWARVGGWVVTPEDVVVGDCDGVIFLPYDRLSDIVPAAESIRDTEHRQAELVRQGKGLREHLQFKAYLAEHEKNPNYGFREHLRKIGGAVEE